MPVRLHINVDHVATLRNARGTPYPDPVLAASLCEAAGADGITAHLREDRRHIRDDDVARLKRAVSSRFNLEMAATAEMLRIAERTRPDVITLVPERREERTTEGGLDLVSQEIAVREAIAMAKATGIRVSLFIAPELSDVERAAELGADQIELHTGEYCHAAAAGESGASRAVELGRLVEAGRAAQARGLELAAGHGLTRHNVGPVVAIEAMAEVNIGHSVMADAVLFGLDRAVRDLRAAIDRALRSGAA